MAVVALAVAAEPIVLEPFAQLDVSAASGLIATQDAFYVIADDETFLAVYDAAGRPRARIPLSPTRLPEEHAARKRRKPDFEALCALPDGRLLVLGSGSTALRMRGALVDPRTGRVREVDLSALYAALGAQLPELNIEGAAVLGERLVLLQRGNGSARVNARIELKLSRVIASLEGSGSIDARALCGIERVGLGDLAGVPLSFTDAAPHPDAGLLFTAAAEDTADTYADGPCTGSVIGVLSNTTVIGARAVAPSCKLEGISFRPGPGSGLELWAVADPDDRSIRATLYRAAYCNAG